MQLSSPARLISKPGHTRIFTPGLWWIRPEYVSFTPLQCACCISPALKNIEQRFLGVLVCAIYDDTTTLGIQSRSSARWGARQKLATDLANVGSELHEGKAEANGMATEDRALIPESIKQPFAIWTDPVTGVQQVGFGVKDCRIPFGDDAYILAMLEESALNICDDIHRFIAGISKHSSHDAPCAVRERFPEVDEVLLRQD
jgi:hypothetical protein